jgi:hypothetical protein
MVPSTVTRRRVTRAAARVGAFAPDAKPGLLEVLATTTAPATVIASP